MSQFDPVETRLIKRVGREVQAYTQGGSPSKDNLRPPSKRGESKPGGPSRRSRSADMVEVVAEKRVAKSELGEEADTDADAEAELDDDDEGM